MGSKPPESVVMLLHKSVEKNSKCDLRPQAGNRFDRKFKSFPSLRSEKLCRRLVKLKYCKKYVPIFYVKNKIFLESSLKRTKPIIDSLRDVVHQKPK